MANTCYFESYTPINKLKGEKKEYWEKYVEKIIPQFENIDSVDYHTLNSAVMAALPEYKEKRYPIKLYAQIDGEYYAHDEDMVFKYCIPDQFLACFDKEDSIKSSVDKSKYELASEEEKEELECSYKSFIFTTTAKKSKNLLRNHLDNIPKENTEYISFGEQIMEFLSKKDDKTIIRLFSGEVCFDDSMETFFSYFPS